MLCILKTSIRCSRFLLFSRIQCLKHRNLSSCVLSYMFLNRYHFCIPIPSFLTASVSQSPGLPCYNEDKPLETLLWQKINDSSLFRNAEDSYSIAAMQYVMRVGLITIGLGLYVLLTGRNTGRPMLCITTGYRDRGVGLSSSLPKWRIAYHTCNLIRPHCAVNSNESCKTIMSHLSCRPYTWWFAVD